MNLRIYGENISKGNSRDTESRDGNAIDRYELFLGSQGQSTSKPVHFGIRALDFVLSLSALIVLLPLFIVLAIIVRIDSPGPVLFKQKRVGHNGEEFWFYKFRSMVADAEAQRLALQKMNEASGPIFKIKNDPRLTNCGRWMRRFSLDELPQFINVLRGDMSLVGPRPALPSEVATYTTRHRRRLDIKPGITGLWQVMGRSDLSFDRSVELDIEYVEQVSVPLYLSILVKTVPAVLSAKGAY
jgi:lipopolysaccharide/colanic/teichoic acid biosynthesis glycosyltransferase